ncbi:DUF2510 domain-containing protein [Streptomyces sp. CBMA152]|uniref:DUF2510 domain-containing protein n=1 Tax=Streptomyces sp. CBMA152 TaxID=1896312 RepID=UPI0016606006|nr:DUF2510 domain-containing protein [Streptomyces sp. CBMA152]MBD0740792.1 hypothetical protein [Streptomyces sp. CBMA152]
MSMTTPPGWYRDPGSPAIERWWDGTAWTGYTRAAGQPVPVVPPPAAATVPLPPVGERPQGRGRGAVVAVVVAAVVLVSAIVAGVALLGKDGSGPAAVAAPDVPTQAATSHGQSTAPTPSASHTDDPSVLVDQLNGITLPVMSGWEKPDSTVGGYPTMWTKATFDCPGDKGAFCHHAVVTSRTATATDLKTAEAIAKQDIADAADDAYDKDILGSRHYGGMVSHREVRSASVVVAGRTGYLVRWSVKTGAGSGGYVESLAFPSSVGSESMIIVRFAFDAGAGTVPLTGMDRITEGIRVIGGTQNGGVGSSVAPPAP